MKVLDLFSGLGGFSQAFKDRGHEVTRVDIAPEFAPDICADVMTLETEGSYDVVLASPPCTEFSKDSMPWCHDAAPDVALLKRTIEIIEEIAPEFWVIENVRGAVRWFAPVLGKPVRHIGSRYLWGEFPMFDARPGYGKWRLWPSPNRTALRSKIPYSLSLNLCVACERALKKGAEK
jgi:site-specific DNA-cytosine methylase